MDSFNGFCLDTRMKKILVFFISLKLKTYLKPIKPNNFQKKADRYSLCANPTVSIPKHETIPTMRKRVSVLLRLDVGIPVTYA